MFNLSRYFSTLSFILIALAAGALGLLYRDLSLQQMTHLAEDRNVAMAQVFRNSLWAGFAETVDDSYGKDAAALRVNSSGGEFQMRVAALMRDTAVIKVKIYNRLGMTVFSSDRRQVGEDKGGNPGFRAALAGAVASELTHRHELDTFEGARSDIDVLSSYIPVVGKGGEIQGVFELYQDVTPFLAQVDRTLWWVTAGVVGVFALLYLMQFLVVRHAHGILREQETRLAAARDSLELQVEQRTAELRRANRQLESEIAERRQAEGKLNYLAYHDPLTGLANRRAFIERLQASMADADREERRLAVLFVDLDQFKQVNDSLGHTVGDQLLVAVADRLSDEVRLVDMLCRLGGDEFICLIESVRDGAEAAEVAGEIAAVCERPFQVDMHTLYISASTGICLYPGDGEDVTELMRNADSAMYRAKAQGRGRHHFYTPEMTRDAREHIRLESALRQALEEGGLEIHFQQQVEPGSGRLAGAEVLARWLHPEMGSIPPARFVALAEETGLIVPLGAWVLRAACRQAMAWRAEGFDLPQVSVNVSVRQLERPEFIDILTAALDESGLEPERLMLEITESVVMVVDDALSLLERLRGLGVKLALDDFGTGYSSLTYLKRLPLSELKIDRSFIAGIGSNPEDEAIVRSVAALSRSLGLEVVAEGVETPEQAAFLQALGCERLQGFLHGRPAAPGDFLTRWKTR